jgi:two-component system response regulator FixJ
MESGAVCSDRTVYIVDDDAALLESAALLLSLGGYVVKTFPSGVAFLSQLSETEPGCVLLDVEMPEMSGMQVLEHLKAMGPRFAVIMLTGVGGVALAVRAMKSGAVDFIEKPCSHDALLAAVQEGFVQLETASADGQAIEDARGRIAQLSVRERDVLRRLLSGSPNKVIAFQLGLSTRTVEMHRANIMEKLQARGLPMAVRMSLAAGLEPIGAEPAKFQSLGAPAKQSAGDRRITTMRC